MISQWILGIKPDWDGLKVDPCIPHDWDGYTVKRSFRGARYTIEIRNPAHVCRGVASMTLDGRKIEGNVLPVLPAGAQAHVVVELG